MTGPPSPAAQSYDEFYRACSARLSGQLYLLTGDREEARDCVQEALERAWTRWGTVNELADPEAWVRTVARRLSVSRWRRTRNSALAWTRHGSPPVVDATDSGDRDALVAALRRLPADQRTALVLHHLCDLDVAAVAAETGVSVTTVTSRLSRGRRALQAHLPSEGRTT